MLHFPILPMELTDHNEAFNSTNHIFEIMTDGIRCILFYDNGNIRLQDENGKDCSKAFPDLQDIRLKTGKAIFDGVITVITDGKPDFESTSKRYRASSVQRIEILTNELPCVCQVWDILSLNEKSLMNIPLIERKDILSDVCFGSDLIQELAWANDNGLTLWTEIEKYNFRGMVAKEKISRYFPGQKSADWLKIKNYKYMEIDVLGYSRTSNAILVGTKKTVLGYATGMGPIEEIIFKKLLQQHGKRVGNTLRLPLSLGVKGRVKFTTFTTSGKMRDCLWMNFIYQD